MPGTRKLGRPTAHRLAMLRGLVTYLLENGRIETTVTRAKEVPGQICVCLPCQNRPQLCPGGEMCIRDRFQGFLCFSV